MKILVSAYACNPIPTVEAYPGEAIVGWNLVRQLSRDHELVVLTRTYNEPALEAARREGRVSNVRFEYLDLPPRVRRIRENYYGFLFYYWLWQVQAFGRARKLIPGGAFDAFHQITFCNYWMPSFIGAFAPLPFLWGPVGGAQRIPKPLRPTLSRRVRVNEALRVFLQTVWEQDPVRRRAARRARAILVCNEETRAKFRKFESKVHLFPVNGISEEDLRPAARDGLSERPFLALYAGRLDPIKGLPLALRAFGRFSAEDPSARFEIVGDGPERGVLEREIARLGLGGRAVLIPWMPRETLLDRMKACDVFLFPSFRDGGGAVVVEAMASGKPVIVLDVGGPGFHVKPEFGLKVTPGRPETVVRDLADALGLMARDPGLRARMGEEARRRAESFYSWDKLGERLAAIYGRALEGAE